jgi:hypothetical protein
VEGVGIEFCEVLAVDLMVEELRPFDWSEDEVRFEFSSDADFEDECDDLGTDCIDWTDDCVDGEDDCEKDVIWLRRFFAWDSNSMISCRNRSASSTTISWSETLKKRECVVYKRISMSFDWMCSILRVSYCVVLVGGNSESCHSVLSQAIVRYPFLQEERKRKWYSLVDCWEYFVCSLLRRFNSLESLKKILEINS